MVWWVAGGGLGMCRGESGVGVSLGGVGIRVVGFWVVCCMGLGNFDGRWLFLGAWYCGMCCMIWVVLGGDRGILRCC
jgi:hypothetical protein